MVPEFLPIPTPSHAHLRLTVAHIIDRGDQRGRTLDLHQHDVGGHRPKALIFQTEGIRRIPQALEEIILFLLLSLFYVGPFLGNPCPKQA